MPLGQICDDGMNVHDGGRHRNCQTVDFNLRFDRHHIRAMVAGNLENRLDGIYRPLGRIAGVSGATNHRTLDLQ